jgi:hypothetical protein
MASENPDGRQMDDVQMDDVQMDDVQAARMLKARILVKSNDDLQWRTCGPLVREREMIPFRRTDAQRYG